MLKGDGDRLYALRDVLLMALLTGQPPDRVGALLLFFHHEVRQLLTFLRKHARAGVMRKLQLGVTLVRKANAFEIDLSSPSDHKTAA
eukprot:4859901-Prymnesium_polylepis.1